VRHQLLWRRHARGRRSPSNGEAVAHDPNPGKDGTSTVMMSGQTTRRSERQGGWSNFVAGLTWNRWEQWWSSRRLQCRSRGKEERESQLRMSGRRKKGGYQGGQRSGMSGATKG
jgi:hypothetical protein